MKKHIVLIGALLLAGWTHAALFTSSDDQFTLDLPSGWTSARKPASGAVLSVTKDTSRIDIKALDDCHKEACIEEKTQQDLVAVKNKKMQVVSNTYTGEEIKRLDFATGDPFFYISFFTPKNDFSAGYFLIGDQAYSILAKDLSYAQTDLLFSFISPKKSVEHTSQSIPTLEMDVTDSRAYDIDPDPAVSEENLELAQPLQTVVAPAAQSTTKKLLPRLAFRTLVTKNMPPYIQYLGHGFDVLVALVFLYWFIQIIALIVRFFVPVPLTSEEGKDNSPYPIRFKRLYGTPSLIMRAKDNQGKRVISLASRWDSLFLFSGIVLVTLAVIIMACMGVLEHIRLMPQTVVVYSIYSAVSLVIPLGMILFFCGILWSQLVLNQYALYDNKGQKIVYILQHGFGFRKEQYTACFIKSKENLFLERKCFSLLHQWTIVNNQHQIIARITEENLPCAIIRKFTGHLWGMLRANYQIEGPDASIGRIVNTRSAFNHFTVNIDNPQALSARDLLVTALTISIRDREKWYPWF